MGRCLEEYCMDCDIFLCGSGGLGHIQHEKGAKYKDGVKCIDCQRKKSPHKPVKPKSKESKNQPVKKFDITTEMDNMFKGLR